MHSIRGSHIAVVLLFASLLMVTGCGTAFKYQPRYTQSYPVVANNGSVVITRAEDLRSQDERLPKWSRKVEVIVARATADELNHAQLFQRVKIHLSGPLADPRYSHMVELRVKQFRYYNPTNALDVGRNILGWMGVRGSLIARSIPRKYISVVEVEFAVLNANTRQTILQRTYSDTRSLTANGYEGKSRQLQQMSDALDTVVEQFVADLARLPSSQGPP